MSLLDEGSRSNWYGHLVDRAISELRSPVALICFFLTILGTAPTIYGWLYPADSSRLLIHYDPFTVYDPGRALGIKMQVGVPQTAEFIPTISTILPDPPLKIMDLNGKEIKSRVYDLEVSVWNGGSQAIDRAQIRRPLVITFPHVNALLGVRVLHENPNDGLKLNILASPAASFEVMWDYMDPGKGFKFAVVLASDQPLYPPQFNDYINARVIDTDRAVPGLSGRNAITTGVLIVLFILVVASFLVRLKQGPILLSVFMAAFVVIVPFFLASFLVKGPAPPF